MRFLSLLGLLLTAFACQREVELCIPGTYLNCPCESALTGVALCLDGRTASACACAQPDWAPPADMAAPSDMTIDNRRWVFITAAPYRGNFEAVEPGNHHADEICKHAALGANLSKDMGTWVAWVDKESLTRLMFDLGNQDPRTWSLTNPRQDKSGVDIEPGFLWATDGGYQINAKNPIDRNEEGHPITSEIYVWMPDDHKNCSNWTATQADGGSLEGAVSPLDDRFIWNDSARRCDNYAHILCLEK